MLFLTDVDHVSFEKANETRQNNLQSATVSLQVVIGLCKRKETAALKSKPPLQMGVSIWLLYDGFFSFTIVRQLYFHILIQICSYFFITIYIGRNMLHSMIIRRTYFSIFFHTTTAILLVDRVSEVPLFMFDVVKIC